jgi:predicted TPR repeat methyltransferase
MDDRFEQAKTHFFAGLARQQDGDLHAAEHHYRASLDLVPGRPSTLINLAAVALALGRPHDALAHADAALAVEHDSVDALLHRATAEARLGAADDALASYARLLRLDPRHAAAWSGHGTLLRDLGRLDEAAQSFREALGHGADPELHGFYLAAVEAPAAAPPTPPRDYVVGLFDAYADEFDTHLVGALRYQAHRRLVDGLVAIEDARYASALDLGCGTGLCGPLVRPRVGRLTGVDLSARMLERARTLGVYDRLECADVVDFLADTDERPELVLAADVFIYVGTLAPLVAGVARAMRGGMFCFTVESLDDDDDADFRLLPSLRYAHAPRYLEALARAHGFDVVAMTRAPVRAEQGRPVDGLYVYLRRIGAVAATVAEGTNGADAADLP